MPYTAKQRAMFNAKAKDNPKMRKLADEANSMPVKKAAKKAVAKKKGSY